MYNVPSSVVVEVVVIGDVVPKHNAFEDVSIKNTIEVEILYAIMSTAHF